MFFYKEYTFTTPYNKEEIRSIVKKMKKPSDNRTWRFEGNSDANEFTLLPLFYPTHHYAFRPEVNGTITEKNIVLKLRIPTSLKILFYIAILFNGSICLYFLYLGTHLELVIGLPVCAFITVGMLFVEFHQCGNRMIQILITKLKLKAA